ncbi:MAG: DUF3095 domain-containing protein [Elainellaceae cyanobacterium]
MMRLPLELSGDRFYSSLPPAKRFFDLANSKFYTAVPNDWYVVITDIVKSTEAIAAGRYKDVNMIGASSILAVLNAANPLEIPFIFGGDGASFVIPPSALAATREALLALRQLAQTRFDLNLRVGVVPVRDVASQVPLRIAKLQITPTYYQACFLGGGVTYATHLVKISPAYQLDVYRQASAVDLSGLECRWQDILSPYGHTISLIVSGVSKTNEPEDCDYREVTQAIERIYGSPQNYQPITREFLKLSFNPENLWAETKARSSRTRYRVPYLLQIMLQNALGFLFMALGIAIGGVRWRAYRDDVAAASDYQKIDDTLRMVISGTPAQTQQLTQYLEQQYRARRLAFGLHISDRALMTCLIIDRRDRHIHLVDSADGGYALAAEQLKRRLQARLAG